MIHTADAQGNQVEVVTVTDTQTLTNKEIIAPIVTHDYGTGHADWTLSATEQKATILNLTGETDITGAAAIATATLGKIFIVSNGTAQTITIKAAGKTGVGIAAAKTAIVMGNGTDFVRVSPDA